MRLIDADALIEILGVMQGLCDTKAALIQNSKIWQQVKDLPTVDAVPVIRCKDCVHWEKNNWNPNGMCNAFDDGSVCILTETDADEYCARAERKEE